MKQKIIEDIFYADATHLLGEIAKVFNEHKQAAYRQMLSEMGTNWIRQRREVVERHKPTPTMKDPVLGITVSLNNINLVDRLSPLMETMANLTAGDIEMVRTYAGAMSLAESKTGFKAHVVVKPQSTIDQPILRFIVSSGDKTQALVCHVYDSDEMRTIGIVPLQRPSLHWRPGLKETFAKVDIFSLYHEDGVENFLDIENTAAVLKQDIISFIAPFRKPKSDSLI